MYSLDEEKIECALGNREIWFLPMQEIQECCISLSDVGTCSIHLSLTAKFRQLDYLCSLIFYV